jgi:uncharacterized protein (TIGR03437 family)
LFTALTLAAAPPPSAPERYALVLADQPVSAVAPTRAELKSSKATAQVARVKSSQNTLRAALEQHDFVVAGSVNTLANEVFVTARPDQVDELKSLPGVIAVVKMTKLKPKLNKAIDLVNTRPAWTALGGANNAGAGIKIAILDTGIDETHPGLIDPTLKTPPGFPLFNSDDGKKHTTTKVIVARTYADVLAVGNGAPEGSLDDDYSVRDRVGHGTAVAMAAAGVPVNSPVGTISGVAPKAWIGNYKIFGSPGVNDFTSSDVVMQAMEQAYLDGMDIALLGAGTLPATWLPTDSGATCNSSAGVPCDPMAAALQNAIAGGLTIIVPAGNDGENGVDTINTPGTITGVITVGASTNVQDLHQTLITATPDYLSMQISDGPQLQRALTAPLSNPGLACTALGANSLAGSIALIQRGTCSFGTKANIAAAAGAVGIVFYREPGGTTLFSPSGLVNSSIPSVLLNEDGGKFLFGYLSAHPGGTVTLDPTTAAVATSSPEFIASYSSAGPNITDQGIKPELVAPGNLYTATQNYDPNGYLYSSNRYVGAEGTSLAAALVTGAVALVKQAHPSYTAAQLKSAVTNTASSGMQDYDGSGNQIDARSIAAGAGKLNVANAVQTNVVLDPPVVSFGQVTGPVSKQLKVTNTGTASVSLQLQVSQRDTDTKATVTVTPSTLTLSPNQSAFLTVALTGSAPASGLYEGIVNVTGGAVPLRIPYLYMAQSNSLGGLIPLVGDSFVTENGTAVDLLFKIVDSSALPAAGVTVAFAPTAAIYSASRTSDNLGIAEGLLYTTNTTGEQSFLAGIPNLATIEFDGRTRPVPQLTGNPVDAASAQAPVQGFAPGSYITLFGTNLSENTMLSSTPYLPVSLAGVSVSFDDPSQSVHAPGHLYYTSAGQINVQVPWELQGSTSAVLKVTLANSSSLNSRADNQNLKTNQTQTVTIPIAQYSPAFFEYSDAGLNVVSALDEGFRLVGSSNPVQRGHVLQLYVNGLGAVAPGTQPASGDPGPSAAPLATTLATPTVTIGGQAASVVFSGLAPGLVGLYQINVVVPAGVGTGAQTITMAIGGVAAKSSNVRVQ